MLVDLYLKWYNRIVKPEQKEIKKLIIGNLIMRHTIPIIA